MGVEKTGSQINVRHVDSSKSFIVTDLSKELQGAIHTPSRHSQQLQKIGVFRSRKITDQDSVPQFVRLPLAQAKNGDKQFWK
jgi:hypothetical protein